MLRDDSHGKPHLNWGLLFSSPLCLLGRINVMMNFILFCFSQRREQTVKLLLKLSEKMDVADLPKRKALVNTKETECLRFHS